MNEENRELLLDLLTLKAVFGLDESQQSQLDDLRDGTADAEFQSLEMTAAAISLAGIETNEPLPEHLYSKIAADAVRFVGVPEPEAATPWPPATESVEDNSYDDAPASSWFGWLGWSLAAAACIVLAVNIWFTQFQPVKEIAKVTPQPEIPRVLTASEMRDSMMSTSTKLVKADWAAGNVKEMKQVTGDVVWSDEKQAGYMRIKGLPVNDAATCYQLWIFDKTQDKATPIDGGTFDVSSDGEVVIPINAKLKAQAPEMFAITVEKHGGVVVSKREKIAALAKVETKTS